MIAEAQALLERVSARCDALDGLIPTLQDERQRLEVMRESLEAFIDQPGSDRVATEDTTSTSATPAAGQGLPSPSPAIQTPDPEVRHSSGPATARTASSPPGGSSAPAPRVACPQCGDKVKAQGLGSHQRKHKAGYQPYERPSRALERGEDGRLQCPDCPARMLPQGMGPHRRARHGATGGRSHRAKPAEAWTPKPETEVTPPSNGKASWLCGRCPGKFSSEAKRQEHYDATGHGSPEPLPGRAVGL